MHSTASTQTDMLFPIIITFRLLCNLLHIIAYTCKEVIVFPESHGIINFAII